MTGSSYSEAQIESQVRDLFLRTGWYADLKTDTAMVNRGQSKGRKHGTLPLGFPDRVFLLGLPGFNLTLAAVVELKTATGRTRPDQTECHELVASAYDIPAHIIHSPEEALHLIAEGRRLRAILEASNNTALKKAVQGGAF